MAAHPTLSKHVFVVNDAEQILELAVTNALALPEITVRVDAAGANGGGASPRSQPSRSN